MFTLRKVLYVGTSKITQEHHRNLFTIVNQGYEAYRLTLGKNPEKLLPGFAINVPLLHTIHKIDMREGPITINELEGYTKDNIPVSIAGTLFYQVTDSYKACFSIQNYLTSISNIGKSGLRSVIGLFQYDDIISDRNQINQKLKQVIGDLSQEWGIHCTKFEIQTFKPSNRGIERQLELQMEAERNRRKQLLDTEASINIAEGEKRRSILVSEGLLQSEKNKADAQLYEMEKYTFGIKRQIGDIKEALGGDAKAAVDYLLKLKQIEQYKAIAEGKNNTVYFLNNKGIEENIMSLLDLAKEKSK